MKHYFLMAAALALAACDNKPSSGAPAGAATSATRASATTTAAGSAAVKGLAAPDTDPQYAALANELKACKEINTNCPAYAKKDDIGKNASDAAAKAKARATFFNWMEEPSSWQLRNAGAHILWTQSLIDDAAAKDETLLKRVLAALQAEPGYGVASDNRYTAGQMADVLVRFVPTPAHRAAIAAFIADTSYKFASARGEVIRLLDAESFNEPAIFPKLKAIAESDGEDKDVRATVRDSLRKAKGDNLAWAKGWLKTQAASSDAKWAGPSTRMLAALGDADDFKELLASLEKRSEDDYLYYATWALADFLGRSDVTVDKAASAKAAEKIANDTKLRAMTRNNALDAIEASGEASFSAVATKLSQDKDASVAKHASDALERHKNAKKK